MHCIELPITIVTTTISCVLYVQYALPHILILCNSGRDQLLCMLAASNDHPAMTDTSQRWTLVEEDLEEQVWRLSLC